MAGTAHPTTGKLSSVDITVGEACQRKLDDDRITYALDMFKRLNELAAKCVEKNKLKLALKILARQRILLNDYEF